jgi:hypothetical protein
MKATLVAKRIAPDVKREISEAHREGRIKLSDIKDDTIYRIVKSFFEAG